MNLLAETTRCVAVPRLDRSELIAIFAGGFIGAVLRYALSEAAPWTPAQWPWATFIVNIAGTALLGYFATRHQERLALSAYRRPFVATGFCGTLTTFSTLQLELLRMLVHGYYGLAAAYVTATLAGGLVAMHVATKLVRRARIVA
jgi:CrcB protein